MRLYICGGMRGYPLFNFPAFDDAERRLIGLGYEVFNPARADRDEDGFDPAKDKPRTLREYMKRDIPAILDCQGLALLDGWEKSEGARIEVEFAKKFDIVCREVAWWVETYHCPVPMQNLIDEEVPKELGIVDNGTTRRFETGATRDSSAEKWDYEGFLSPLVLREYARYMHGHRKQSDGSLRDSANWTKGIPRDVYMKSKWRHLMASWSLHRGLKVQDERDGREVTLKESLCAELFNTMGYLHVVLTEEHT